MKQKFEPYKKGYLDVTDGHSLYYEFYGNPKGKPALYLHGGPGAGFEDKNKRFFNPDVWNVLFFDQRGAGKSKPFASLHENTTPKLVEDINKLLEFAGFKNVLLFGGSWGSTLALIYAIQNKEKVSGLLLRGIYLGSTSDNDYLINGAIKEFFPEKWERFISLVSKEKRDDVIGYYLDKMLNGDSKTKDTYAYEWSYYESAVIALNVTDQEIEKDLKDGSYIALSPIEAIYMKHHSFIPDNYILDNAHVLSNLPVSIVHGRYDFVCPPINAWKLHKAIKSSTLSYVFAGHSSSEIEVEKKLLEELNRFETLF